MRATRDLSEPRRIAVFGMFGQLNMGNECTLEAFLVNLRTHLPDAEPFCICPEPQDVLVRHQIPAILMSVGAEHGAPRGARGLVAGLIQPLLTRLRAFRWAYSRLRNTEIVAVAGTGIFEENVGLSRGWLFDVLTWCIAARLRRCRLAFVSIGAGPIHTRWARWVVKATLRLADYVSYRDRFSEEYMASIGLSTTSHHVCPDLAFSLPLPPRQCAAGLEPRGGLVVGIGIMDYFGQRKANRRTREEYVLYLARIADFISRLLNKGCQVKILGGDARYDGRVVTDLKQMLAQRNVFPDDRRLSEATFGTVQDVIDQIQSVDAVVAARFHNLIVALMLTKPTISVAYHDKNEVLMTTFGLPDASQNVDELNVTELERQLFRIMDAWPSWKPRVEEKLGEFRQQLDDQYHRLFHQSRSGRRAPGRYCG